MRRLHHFWLLPIISLCSLLAPVGAHAAPYDPNGFHLQSSQMYVHEDAGAAVITVERTDTSEAAQVRYITIGDPVGTAVGKIDFTPVKGELDFAVGQQSASFAVRIIDHGVDTIPKTVQVSLFGPSPIGFASPYKSTLTIINDDPVSAPIPGNPLGVDPANGNPLVGARFYVNPRSDPARAAHRYHALRVIAREPGTMRFGKFSGSDVGLAVSRYLTRAAVEQPGAVPLISTYRIVDGACSTGGDSPAQAASYRAFISRFAQGIGSFRAVLFLEMDSIITTPCLTHEGLATRIGELQYAINVLTANCPHLVIYVDAGAADALHAVDAARLLNEIGVAKIQGFFLNSTHFDWTMNEVRYGEQISRMTGGKHFVINTGANGRGPLRPPDRATEGNEVLCNPPGRGLGPKPTTHTGLPNVDMFAWTSNPGESGGRCGAGAPPTGAYWPKYALGLVRHANFKVRR